MHGVVKLGEQGKVVGWTERGSEGPGLSRSFLVVMHVQGCLVSRHNKGHAFS
jgi:hypothetical protein